MTTARRKPDLYGRLADGYLRHLFGLSYVDDRDAVVLNVGDVDFAPVGTYAQAVREFAGLELADNLFLLYVDDQHIVIFRVRRGSHLAPPHPSVISRDNTDSPRA